jgi:membrane-bound ClpP family serine protease
MKKLKEFYQSAEQIILFYGLVIYLTGFMFIFNEQMTTTNWMGIVWITQFIVLGTLLVKKSNQKGWKWPSRF